MKENLLGVFYLPYSQVLRDNATERRSRGITPLPLGAEWGNAVVEGCRRFSLYSEPEGGKETWSRG